MPVATTHFIFKFPVPFTNHLGWNSGNDCVWCNIMSNDSSCSNDCSLSYVYAMEDYGGKIQIFP